MVALTAVQKSELKRLESAISKGQAAFFEMCKAILEIDTRKLYIPCPSLVDYCEKRWDMTASEVCRYRGAALVLEHLNGFDVLPKNESQARELVKLKHQKPQQEVWQAVIDSGKKITAKLVEDTAKSLLNDEEPEPAPEPAPEPVTSPVFDLVSVVQHLQHIEEELKNAKLSEDERKSLAENVGHMEALVQSIRAWIG